MSLARDCSNQRLHFLALPFQPQLAIVLEPRGALNGIKVHVPSGSKTCALGRGELPRIAAVAHFFQLLDVATKFRARDIALASPKIRPFGEPVKLRKYA